MAPPDTTENRDPERGKPGARLEQALTALATSQAEVARRISTPASYLNDVIRGRRSLTAAFAGALQNEFGIDKIWLLHGDGQMFRRLPPQPSLPSTASMTPLPLLDRPCRGNPLDSSAWAGSAHPVPRGQAQATAPDRYRYVLRISDQGATGDIRDGDLIVVETLTDRERMESSQCWFVVMSNKVIQIRRLRQSERQGSEIWGWCAGIVWRPFPTLE